MFGEVTFGYQANAAVGNSVPTEVRFRRVYGYVGRMYEAACKNVLLAETQVGTSRHGFEHGARCDHAGRDVIAVFQPVGRGPIEPDGSNTRRVACYCAAGFAR